MSKRVLLVEKDWEFGGRLPELLVEKGLKVEVVASGELALGSIRESFPDLIVTDMDAKGFEGARFLDSLRELRLLEHIPALVIVSNEAESEEARSKGVFTRSRPYCAGEMAGFIEKMA